MTWPTATIDAVERRIDSTTRWVVDGRLIPLRAAWRDNTWVRWRLPLLLTFVVVIGYLWVFISLSYVRHHHFGSFDYDLGMYDHGIWQLSRGRGFMTVRGMHIFGHHANIGYLLFVPAYWLGAGPHFLNIMNVVGVTAVAWPVYLLGRFHLRSRWAGFWLVVAYLFHFSPQWKIQETFHAESMAAPFLVGAFYLASRKRWGWYWFCIVGALIWKEDVALFVTMLGFVVWFLYGERRTGIKTILAGVAWFAVATQLFIPAFAEGAAVYDGLFGELGGSAREVVTNSIRHPTMLGQHLHDHGAIDGAVELMLPYGLISVANPLVALMGIPQHVINFASIQNFTWDLRWHYAFFPYLAFMLAAFRTAVTRRTVVAWALIFVMVSGVYLTREQGIGPWASGNYYSGWWPLTDNPRNEAIRDVLEEVPDDAVVSAPYFMVPHLSHREHVYTFPNPWHASNYGVAGVPAPPDPDTVDILLADEAQVCPDSPDPQPDCALWQGIIASPDFEEAARSDQIVMYRRVTE